MLDKALNPLAPDKERLSIRQAQIREQMLELFLEEGFIHFTVGDVAQRLSCSKATIYTIADSKEQLVTSVIRLFFKRAAGAVELAVGTEQTPATRVGAYLENIAAALRPASTRFMTDLYAYKPARLIYEFNTRIAASRIKDMVEDGVATGAFRPVNAAFVGEVVAAVIVRIHHGDIAAASGFSDADAFAELGRIILTGVSTSGTD